MLSRRALLVAAGGGLLARPARAEALDGPPLWRIARARGLRYGSSAATWQLDDRDYRGAFQREAGALLTEDDLLWYRIRPRPHAELDFSHADRIVGFAERADLAVIGAHLVWDQGFGRGWSHRDLWQLGRRQARELLYGTVGAVVGRYRGRVEDWSVVNEVVANGDESAWHGLRRDVPWFATIGPTYVADAFHVAHEHAPHACLILNEFGFETVDASGLDPEPKRAATLRVLDRLIAERVPVQALGVQAHLFADRFTERFDARAYQTFLRRVADRGLRILVTELDVLDDGLPADPSVRDPLIADVYRRYLDVTLTEPAVDTVLTFGLSDRYTWLEEDDPRDDGAHRRPLPLSRRMVPKPAYDALAASLGSAPEH